MPADRRHWTTEPTAIRDGRRMMHQGTRSQIAAAQTTLRAAWPELRLSVWRADAIMIGQFLATRLAMAPAEDRYPGRTDDQRRAEIAAGRGTSPDELDELGLL